MKAIELLNANPKTAEVLRAWFMEKMVESINNAQDVPDEFKEFMRQQGIDNEKLSIMIDAQPRSLFDVFDAQGIIINVFHVVGKFHAQISDNDAETEATTRKDAEELIIQHVFRILEEKLTPIESPQLEE
jgi:hypothetical protein